MGKTDVWGVFPVFGAWAQRAGEGGVCWGSFIHELIPEFSVEGGHGDLQVHGMGWQKVGG